MVMSTALAPRSKGSAANGAMSLLASCAFTAIALTFMACSNESRHRTIIYDHSWSVAASVENSWCAPELRTSCEQQKTQTEAELSNKLAKAFSSAPDCANVEFLVSSDDGKRSEGLEDSLAQNAWKFGDGYRYWRLRVDIHPGSTSQPFTLGPGNKHALVVGGDDVEHSVSYICEAAKHNGITAYW
jgi:hypothetical protein